MRMIANPVPIFVTVVALVFAAPARAQQSHPPGPSENGSYLMPYLSEVHDRPLPKPVTVDYLQRWYVPGKNYVTLRPVSGAETASADKSMTEKPGPKLPRMGIVRSIGNKPISIADAMVLKPSETTTQDVRTLAIQSPGAFGLRIHFSKFDVRKGEVLVFAPTEDELIVRGPYQDLGPNGNGEFWTASLPGDSAFIELRGDDGTGHIEIDQVVHIDNMQFQSSSHRPMSSQRIFASSTLTGFDNDDLLKDELQVGSPNVPQSDPLVQSPSEAACHLDVACYSDHTNPGAVQATVVLAFVTASGSAPFCTGTILNDLDGDTLVPYLLSAYHCLNTQAEVNSLEVVFFFQKSSCGGPLPSFSSLPRLVGGTLLASNSDDSSNDMVFIRMNGIPPAGAVFSGWTTGSLPDYSYGIHHPDGTYKRVTFFERSSYLLCGQFTGSDYWLGEALSGGIEGASSGSGLFDTQGRLYGQLSAVCGLDAPDPACAGQESWRAAYGKFDVTYSSIWPWMAIGGTVNVNRGYGGVERGTPESPFRTVAAGHNFAWNGSRLKIKTGNYNEQVTLSKQIILVPDGGPVIIGQ